MTDLDHFELRLGAAVRADADLGLGRFDPAAIARAAIAGGRSRSLRGRLHSAAFGNAARVPRRYPVTNMLFRFAAVALVGVLAVGGAFYLLRPGPAVIGGPTPTPGPTASASPSASPTTSASPTIVPVRPASWTATGSMITPRSQFAAVLLPDGKVLALGGMNGNDPLSSAELYDPATGTWTATGSMVTHAGAGFTATLLRDGNVLVAGGSSAELYDPVTGTWIATGTMATPHGGGSTATLLLDGKVLALSGTYGDAISGTATHNSAELYDPATGTWTATGSFVAARYGHMATLLRDGRVLVAGGATCPAWSGCDLASAELYDPATGTWTATGSMAGGMSGQYGHMATLLPDGRVLERGAPPELYDPATGTWTATGGTVIAFNGPGVLLSNGGVVVLIDTVAYLFDPGAGSWTPAGTMAVHGYGYTATLLPDGKVLVAGGLDADAADASAALASAELFDPGTWSPSPIVPATPAPSPTP